MVHSARGGLPPPSSRERPGCSTPPGTCRPPAHGPSGQSGGTSAGSATARPARPPRLPESPTPRRSRASAADVRRVVHFEHDLRPLAAADVYVACPDVVLQRVQVENLVRLHQHLALAGRVVAHQVRGPEGLDRRTSGGRNSLRQPRKPLRGMFVEPGRRLAHDDRRSVRASQLLDPAVVVPDLFAGDALRPATGEVGQAERRFLGPRNPSWPFNPGRLRGGPPGSEYLPPAERKSARPARTASHRGRSPRDDRGAGRRAPTSSTSSFPAHRCT